MQQCGSCPRGPFCAFAHIESKLVQHLISKPFVASHLHCNMIIVLLCKTCFKLPPEPLVPEDPPFSTSSTPPSRPPEPLLAPEESSSPSRHSVGPVSVSSCIPDPSSLSGGSCSEEQSLLGSTLSFCEHTSGGAEPPPWAGEGGYCRAPGFEREDQVRIQGKNQLTGLIMKHGSLVKNILR